MCAVSQISRFNAIGCGNENAQRKIGIKALRLVYSTPCNGAPIGCWDNLLYSTSRRSRVHLFRPLFSQNRQPELRNRRLLEQELESIVVKSKSVPPSPWSCFLPWLQPAPPEKADRRQDGPRARALLRESPQQQQHAAEEPSRKLGQSLSWGTLKKCGPPAVLFAYRPPQEGLAVCSQGKESN
jgi:hypothetical protein